MSFSSDMALTAAELLTEFGQAVTVTRFSLGAQDPLTGVVTPTEVTSAETGVLLDFEYRTFGEALRPMEMVNHNNKRLLMTVVTRVKAGDQVEVDGAIYRIVVIKLLNPAGTRIMYDLWIQQ